jgi:hypothetical protein
MNKNVEFKLQSRLEKRPNKTVLMLHINRVYPKTQEEAQ